jgi:hypothetical protein
MFVSETVLKVRILLLFKQLIRCFAAFSDLNPSCCKTTKLPQPESGTSFTKTGKSNNTDLIIGNSDKNLKWIIPF